MSDATDDTASVSDGSVRPEPQEVRERCGFSTEPSGELERLPFQLRAHAPLIQLLAQPPDVVVDQLCEGKPRDFRVDCEDHVAMSAYFVEPGRVAARVIAMLSTMTYASQPHEGAAYDGKLMPEGSDLLTLAESIETIIQEALAGILEDGALPRMAGSPRCPLIDAIGTALGVDDATAHGMIDTLNALDFDDRHVFFHCIVKRMTPEGYANQFREDARVISVMLRNLSKLAIDGPPGPH